MKKVLVGLFTACLLTACFPNTRYVDYHHTAVSGWEKDSVLVFLVPPLDEGGPYVEEIGLRTESSYPFLHLSLVVEQQVVSLGSAAKDQVSRNEKHIVDTLDLPIYEEDGSPVGLGLSVYRQELPFRFLNLQSGDSMVVKIHHNMRRRLLPGVSEVGIHLLKRD